MLLLAAVQSFCGRFADALLTTMSPLTYERGDYLDGTESVDPDYEPPNPPGAVEAATPQAPAPGFSLPMYKADDLAEIAAEYIVRIPTVSNQVAKTTAELIVSHLTYELQSLVYEQNNPQK
jgi:hypothetical protein